jgi:hypothetical protein
MNWGEIKYIVSFVATINLNIFKYKQHSNVAPISWRC